jgi:DNA-binding NarL/FixJ family response regulator
MEPITVVLAEDHNLVREGLRALLEEMGDFKVIGQAGDGIQALDLAEKLRPNVVVMDIAMPNLNGLEATSRLREAMNPAHIIMLSQHHDEAYVVQALLAGAVGYLLKDAVVDELPQAIRAVAEGERYLSKKLPREAIESGLKERESYLAPLERLTPREREVLQLVAEGNTNRQIANKLKISIKTVEKHRFNLMEKLNMRDVTALVRFAIANGIVSAQE